MQITFIGLGIMGSRMAANLLKHKVNLTVFNRSETPLPELLRLGARTEKNSLKAVENADIVFTMLSTPEVVGEVMFGKKGCLPAMKKGALWVDCTTVNPSFSKSSAQKAENLNIRFIDAPVAGTKPVAEKAELVFFAGGSESDIREAEPLLLFMGRQIVHVGEAGNGSALKMLVNALLANSMLIFSETLLLGEKIGFTKDFLLNTLPNLPVTAPFIKGKTEMIRHDTYDVQFPLEWMLKDLRLISETAEEYGVLHRMTSQAEEIYRQANQDGFSRKDFSAIYDFLKGKP